MWLQSVRLDQNLGSPVHQCRSQAPTIPLTGYGANLSQLHATLVAGRSIGDDATGNLNRNVLNSDTPAMASGKLSLM